MILVGDEVTFNQNNNIYRVKATNPDGVTVELYGQSFALTWEQANTLGMKIKQAVEKKKKKYTVMLSIRVNVELVSERETDAIDDAVSIILGSLNSVEGIRAEKNFSPVIVGSEDD